MACFTRSRVAPRATRSRPETSNSAFTDPDADAVITSADNTKFRVHRYILAKASPVFEGMFSLPPVPSTLEGGQTVSGEEELPVIPLTEPGRIVEQLLKFCYPSLNGTVPDSQTLRQLFSAADKYEMTGVTMQLTAVLRTRFLEKEPNRAYALACIYGLREEAKLAAKCTLNQPIPGPALSEYQELSATMYHKLVVYRQKCIDLIHPLLDDWNYKVWGMREVSWTGTNCSRCLGAGKVAFWFADHLERTKAAYIARPRGASVSSTKISQDTVSKHFTGEPQCSCFSKAPMRLIEFNERLAAVLELKISEIPFDYASRR